MDKILKNFTVEELQELLDEIGIREENIEELIDNTWKELQRYLRFKYIMRLRDEKIKTERK